MLDELDRFIAGALAAGSSAVVIATEAHRTDLLRRLERRGLNMAALTGQGRYRALDAAQGLSECMVDGWPDEHRFADVIGGAIAAAAAADHNAPVCAFGEMVRLLWAQGHREAAIRLEELWNELSRTHAFSLLCGYSMGNFYKQTKQYKAVCAQHTHVIKPEEKVIPFERRKVARTASKENPEALQGFHASHLMFVIDEASGVPEEIYEAAEGALSTSGARVLMQGNPTRTSGTFYSSHHKDRGSYTALHFRSQDSPLVDPSYRERLVRKWGEGSNIVRVRADGDFPRQEDDVLISLDLTEPCLSREPCAGEGLRKLGVDVARMGSDRTTMVLRQGRVVEHLRIFAKQDTMVTVGCIVAVLEAWQVDEIDVDVIGLGAGVYDRLAELKREGRLRCAVVAVNVAQKAPTVRHPADAKPRLLRDYLWLEVARWLRDEAPTFVASDRQACEDLAGELASVHYGLDSQGALVVEDKEAMRKRLGHSPDLADGLCCTMAPAPKAGGMVRITGY